jgi:hypothetical protein
MYKYMRPIPNGFRDKAMDVIVRVMEGKDAFRCSTRHGLTLVAKRIDVGGGILEVLPSA